MATNLKAKVTAHHRRASSSAPSTPRSLHLIHSRRESTTDAEDLLPLPQKPMPHYRRPTLSSAHETNCPNVNKQHQRFIVRKMRSIDNKFSPSSPASPSSQPHKSQRAATTTTHQHHKSATITTSDVNSIPRTQRKAQHSAHLQTSATFPRPTKSNAVSKANIKVNTLQLKTRSTVKEKVKKGVEHEHIPRDVHPGGLDDGGSEDHYEGSGESLAGESPASEWKEKSNPMLEPSRVRVRQGGEEGESEHEGVKLVRQEGKGRKESPPASNQVIEEAASKLAGKRRSKVAALVGAFETVMSMQEQEGTEKEVAEAVEASAGDVEMEEVVSKDKEEENAVVTVEEVKQEEEKTADNVEDAAAETTAMAAEGDSVSKEVIEAMAAEDDSVSKEVIEPSEKREEGSSESVKGAQLLPEE